MKDVKDVVVIGAGPAGLIAAAQAAKNGNSVTLLEKNAKVGRKLYISGKGRCNLTNSCDINTLIKNTPGNGSFLYSAFNKFSSLDIIEYFNGLGVKTKVERGNRVFPESDKASDIIDALFKNVQRNGVELILNAEVTEIGFGSAGNLNTDISTNDSVSASVNNIKQVEYSKDGKPHKIQCKNIILATGGISYPATGSTGDGYKFAGKAGHTVIDPKPSLVSMNTSEKWVANLQGLSLKNVSVKLIKNKKEKLFEDFGEMLFTHCGVSGPLILSASSRVRDFNYENLELYIDLKPALSNEQLDLRIQRDFNKYINCNFINSLNDLLPKSLIPVVVMLSETGGELPVNQITKEERHRLVETIKNFKLTPVSPGSVEEAIVTSGGICVKEIDPKTMESKLVPGLYFAGEIIDVDAYTGGFNLTIAFSTGYTAGSGIIHNA